MKNQMNQIDPITRQIPVYNMVVYGYGKIGKAIKTLFEKRKAQYTTNEMYSVDPNPETKADFIAIKEWDNISHWLEKSYIHIIAIDTGVIEEKYCTVPDTDKVRTLISDIVEQRGIDNPNNDIIVIESTVEIGFYDSIVNLYPNWDIIISPERYNEDALHTDGWYMNSSKVCGYVSPEVHERLIDYFNIFRAEEIELLFTSNQEAEATKVIENSYRYLLLSFTNEIYRMNVPNVDPRNVLNLVATRGLIDVSAMGPGLIGGGCIPVDPMYFPNYQQSLINDVILHEKHRISIIVKNLHDYIKNNAIINITLLGFAYKANTTSTKNSGYKTVIAQLKSLLKDTDIKIIEIDHYVTGVNIDETILRESDLVLVGANHWINFYGRSMLYSDLAETYCQNVIDLNTYGQEDPNQES